MARAARLHSSPLGPRLLSSPARLRSSPLAVMMPCLDAAMRSRWRFSTESGRIGPRGARGPAGALFNLPSVKTPEAEYSPGMARSKEAARRASQHDVRSRRSIARAPVSRDCWSWGGLLRETSSLPYMSLAAVGSKSLSWLTSFFGHGNASRIRNGLAKTPTCEALPADCGANPWSSASVREAEEAKALAESSLE